MYKRNDDDESHDEGDDEDMHIDEDEMGHENKKPVDKHYEMDQPSGDSGTASDGQHMPDSVDLMTSHSENC
jgi:hypothetical protein